MPTPEDRYNDQTPRTLTESERDIRPGSNAAELKADLNTGRTGDKINVFDPGLSMLGTDDEAGGYPMTPEDISVARAQERREPKSFAPAMPSHDAGGAPSAGATSPPTVSLSEDSLHEGSERRFSPAVAAALIGSAALVGVVYALLA